MAHVAKYARSACGHLTAHYGRAKIFDPATGKMEYVKFGNQDIDPSRTHMNYNLAPEREGGQMEYLRQRLTQVRCLNRADVNVMCSWVVTLPTKDESGEEIEYTREDADEFFRENYKFLCARYGEENVISAYVHMDETTPHMHFAFVPVCYDRKRDDYKVSAKTVVSRKDLQSFHTDLQEHLDTRCETYYPVLNGATDGGNRTIADLKAERTQDASEMAQAVLQECLDQSFEAQIRASEANLEADKLEKRVAELKSEVVELEAARAELPALKEQISEARSELGKIVVELAATKTAVREERARGVQQFDSHSALDAAVAQAREKEKENLLVKFAQHIIDTVPGMRQLWEQFKSLEAAKERRKSKTKDDPVL